MGVKNKVIASHNLNAQSSRSHAIFSMTVQSVDPFNLVRKLVLIMGVNFRAM